MRTCQECMHWTHNAWSHNPEFRHCAHPKALEEAEEVCRDDDGRPYNAGFVTGPEFPCPYEEEVTP